MEEHQQRTTSLAKKVNIDVVWHGRRATLAWHNPAAMIGESYDGSDIRVAPLPPLNLFFGSERV
jgi:hypothetical protein